jgi:hypothetical protein
MRWLRSTAAGLPALLLVPLTAAPSQAVVPANDHPAGAVRLHPGDQVTQDTTEATTDAQDAALNAACGAPYTNASVWYQFSTRRARDLLLDMAGSDYSGGFLVFEGAPAADSLVACGETAVGLRAAAGTTYTVMVVSDTEKNGGTLVVSLHRPPPSPNIRVTVAPRGLAYRGGAARLHGTYSCRNAPGDSGISGTLVQRVGRLKIPARFRDTVRCDGRTRRWSARAVSATGIFDRGPAKVRIRAFACGMFSCVAVGHSPQRIRLVRASAADKRARTRPAEQGRAVVVHPRPIVDRAPAWDAGSTTEERWDRH